MGRARIVSVHEYELKSEVTGEQFLRAVAEAQSRGLFDLPGLLEYRVLRGVKGVRRGSFTAIWIYESRPAWEAVWGPPEAPKSKEDYPPAWRIWEDELLEPLLDRDPDTVRYTSYEVVAANDLQVGEEATS